MAPTVAVGVILIALVFLASAWHYWPGYTASRFTSLAYHGKFEELNQYLPEGQQWGVGADGSITLSAEDGSTLTIPADALPIVAAESNRPSESARWAGRWEFRLGTLSRPTCTIRCTAKYGKVTCQTIENVTP
jgi:hypothetical protein